jgi:signal peptidase I
VQDGEEKLLMAAAGPGLLAEVLRRFGEVRLRVSGTSMVPAIRPGDVLIVRRCAIEDIDPGDVVLFRGGRRLFVHRVTRTLLGSGPAVLMTKGDALRRHDPPVRSSHLLGRVTQIRANKPVLRDRLRYSRIGSTCERVVHKYRAALGRLRRR